MRRQYITHPSFQASFTLSMGLGGVFVVLLLGLSSMGTFYIFLKKLPLNDMQTQVLSSGIHTLFIATLILSASLAVALSLVGIYFSYKFVGPLARLEQWLERFLAGEKTEFPRLRKGDELEASAKLLLAIVSKMRPPEPE